MTGDVDLSLPAFDSYQILRRLGQGGMSDVYLAEDTRLHRKVAIKVIKPDVVEPGQIDRVLNEARLLAKINHPNVVQVYDIISANEQIALVMEYVQGKTLRQYASEKISPLEDKLTLIGQISQGLAIAHRHNVVHCDLKPDNIMIDGQGQVKITDFGIGLDLVTQQCTEAPADQHYRRYVSAHASSPEQLSDGEVDFRSDLFALGLLAFNLIGDEHPFGTGSGTQVAQRIVKNEAKDARTLIPALPVELCTLLNQLLQKDPDKRPQQSELVASQFKQILVMLCDRQNLAQDTLPLDAIDVNVTLPASASKPFKTNISKPKKAVVGIALVSTLLLSCLIYMVYGQTPPPRHVVVLTPNISETSVADEQQLQMVKATIDDAIRQVIINTKGMNLLATLKASQTAGSREQIAKASGATDIVSAIMDCQQNRCDMSFTRTSGEQQIVTAQTNWPIALGNYRDIYNAGRAQAQLLFAGHDGLHLRSRRIDEADYSQYVQIYLDVSINGASTKDNLQRLEKLIAHSAHLYALYSLYRRVAVNLYHDSHDEQYLQQLRQVLRQAPDQYKDSVFHTIDSIYLEVKAGELENARYLMDIAQKRGADMAQVHELQGKWYGANNEINKAVEHYEKALLIRPGKSYLSNLAFFHFQLGQLKKASDYLIRVLSYAEDDYFANQMLADIALQSGDLDLAIKGYSKAIDKQPSAFDHYNLSIAYMMNGQYTLGLEAAQNAVKDNEHNALFLLSLADTYKVTGQMTLANEGYRKILVMEQNKTTFDAWTNKAQAYAQLGEKDLSVMALARARAQGENKVEYANTASLVHILAGEYHSALAEVNNAVDSGYGLIWFNYPWYQPLCQYESFGTLLADLGSRSICLNSG